LHHRFLHHWNWPPKNVKAALMRPYLTHEISRILKPNRSVWAAL
jgi:hypothetical protein